MSKTSPNPQICMYAVGMCVSMYKIQKGARICKGKKDMKKISFGKENISRNNGDFKVREKSGLNTMKQISWHTHRNMELNI